MDVTKIASGTYRLWHSDAAISNILVLFNC